MIQLIVITFLFCFIQIKAHAFVPSHKLIKSHLDNRRNISSQIPLLISRGGNRCIYKSCIENSFFFFFFRMIQHNFVSTHFISFVASKINYNVDTIEKKLQNDAISMQYLAMYMKVYKNP